MASREGINALRISLRSLSSLLCGLFALEVQGPGAEQLAAVHCVAVEAASGMASAINRRREGHYNSRRQTIRQRLEEPEHDDNARHERCDHEHSRLVELGTGAWA